MAIFVLVHGGCHGGWCWERVVPLLEAQGHQVLAPDLPGAGNDPAPIRDVTLAGRVAFLSNLVAQQSEPVILVGHSMGGAVISSTAEAVPGNIAALVFLSAFLLKDGETIWDAAVRVPAPKPELIIAEDGKANLFSESSVRDLFYNTTPALWIGKVLPRLREESILVAASPVHVTAERFGRVPRYYIETLLDRAIVPELQSLMREDWPCREVLEMETDHSPFYAAPGILAERFHSIAEAIK